MTQETNLTELIKQAAIRDNPDKEFAEAPDLGIDLVAHKIFYECAWLVCVSVAVFFTGFSYKDFSLSGKVLIAFITSTTINVVGLFVVVAKWMFPTVQNNTNEKANQSIHADAKSRAGD